jgi:tripartite-type tricarboxylate transporter receptor subunit TctC
MTMRTKPAYYLAFSAIWLAVATGSASAQDDDYFKGKTVTVIVGFSAGGGYDVYARALARYFGKHVPGTPNVIVQNMPGAGSLTSVRYLNGPAAKDGTVITLFNPGVITDSLLNPEKVKLKLDQFAWLGSITRDFRVCYAWVKTGIKSYADLASGREFIMGATGVNTSNYMNGAMLRSLLGLNVRQITGFPGSNEMRLAIERSELHGDCGSWSSVPDDWIKRKQINVFLRFSPRLDPEVPATVPFAVDVAKTDEQKRLIRILIGAGELGRPFVLSKLVPADRLKMLQSAFATTMKDAGFLAETKKLGLPVDPAFPDEVATILKEIYSASPELVAKAKQAIK